MMLVFYAYTLYFPGDENILVDSSLITATDDPAFAGIISTLQLYDPYPNPALESVDFEYYVAEKKPVEVALFDLAGRCISRQEVQVFQGVNRGHLSISGVAAGTYILTLQQGDVTRSKTLIKQGNR
jgi:hypothetical protein